MQNFFDQFDRQTQQETLVPVTPPARPDPYKEQSAANEAERLRLAREAAEREKAKFAIEQEEREEKARVSSEAKAKTAADLRRNLETIRRIMTDVNDNAGWGETGTSGAIMRAIGPPGTAGYSLASELETLKANNAFSGLVGLAEQGIKLTPVSNDEIRLAAASIANLDPNTDHETFLRTLRGLEERYVKTLSSLESDGAKTADPQTVADVAQWGASVAAGRGGEDKNPPGGNPRSPTGRVPGATMDNITFDIDTGTGAFGSELKSPRLSPQQQAALVAFLRANAGNVSFGPESMDAFYRSIGIQGGAVPGDDAFYDAVRKGEGFRTEPDYSESDEAFRRAAMEASLEEAPEGTDLSRVGLEKGILLNMTDELRGGFGGVKSLLGGEGFASGYRRERDIERALQERSREQSGVAPEVIGSLLTPVGILGRARTVGQFMRQGAAVGGAAGFGEGEGLPGSLAGAAVGGAVGGALGGALSQAPRVAGAALNTQTGQRVAGAVNRGIDSLRRPRGQLDTEVIEAGERVGVPVRLPDALPEARNAMAVAEASPTAGPRIKAALDEDAALVRERLRAQATGGQVLQDDDLGAMIQGAGARFIAKSRAQADTLYKRAERAAGDARILPVQASLAIRRNINELAEAGETTNSPAIRYLRELNEDLSREGGLSIQALRSLRTNMRGQIDQRGLTKTDVERRVMQVLDAASDDIARALGDNPSAVEAYRAADDFFREKQAFIKDVVQKFTGPRVNGQTVSMSAERAASTLKNMMQSKRGDMRRFQEMISRLDQNERRDLAASVAEQLGTARNGEFSLAALATNTSKMNPRALRLLFGDDGARAIQDLKVLARAKADTLGGLNTSKSGVVAAGTTTAKDLLLGALGGGLGGVPGAMAGMAARGGLERIVSGRAAKLLLNPDFTRWLRQMPDVANPAAIERHIDKLNKIASREQAFLMDAQAIQDFLRSAMSQSPTRAAASGQDEQDRR